MPTLTTLRARHDDECDELTRYAGNAALCALGSEMLIALLSAVLLEAKVVFVAPNMRLLSAVTLCWIAWLRPFVWQVFKKVSIYYN